MDQKYGEFNDCKLEIFGIMNLYTKKVVEIGSYFTHCIDI